MGNLSEIKRDILINSLSASDFGVYTDTLKSEKVLFFKKHGYSFFAHGEVTIDFGSIAAPASAGTAKVILLALNNIAPSDTTAYDETVRIDPKYKNPGVDKAAYYAAPTYGNTYSVATSGGYITQASMISIIDNISNQIYSDPENTWVKGGAAVVVTGYAAADNIVIDGTTYAAVANVTAMVAAINAGTKAYAYVISASSFALIYRVAYTEPTTAGSLTFSNVMLGLIGQDAEISFDTFVRQPLISSTVLVAPVYPFLTSAEIDAIVRNSGSHGELAMFSPADRPIAGAAYTKINVFSSSDAYNNQTPGSDIKHMNSVNLYILTSELTKDYWDASDYNAELGSAGFAADTNFNELIAYWKA